MLQFMETVFENWWQMQKGCLPKPPVCRYEICILYDDGSIEDFENKSEQQSNMNGESLSIRLGMGGGVPNENV
jgi:hypothetical protein